MTIREALQAVVSEARGGFSEYAKAYAQAGLDLGGSQRAVVKESNGMVVIEHEKTGEMMIGDELKTQVLYVISNLGGWSGERAREVKAVLKKAVK